MKTYELEVNPKETTHFENLKWGDVFMLTAGNTQSIFIVTSTTVTGVVDEVLELFTRAKCNPKLFLTSKSEVTVMSVRERIPF